LQVWRKVIDVTSVERLAMEMRVESHFSQADSSAVVPETPASRRLGKVNALNDSPINLCNQSRSQRLTTQMQNVGYAGGSPMPITRASVPLRRIGPVLPRD
jgi:hypothetical protein